MSTKFDRYKEICQKMEEFNFEQQALYTFAVLQILSPIAIEIVGAERKLVFEEALQTARKMVNGVRLETSGLKKSVYEAANPYYIKDGVLFEKGKPWDGPNNEFIDPEEAEDALNEFYSDLPATEKDVVTIFRIVECFFYLIEKESDISIKNWVPSSTLGIFEGIDDNLEREIFDPETATQIKRDFEENEGLTELKVVELIALETNPTKDTIERVVRIAERTSRDLETKIRLLKKFGQWAYSDN